jgi:hypothetical protein
LFLTPSFNRLSLSTENRMNELNACITHSPISW